jgi:NADH-ubiquinone oxidoreductase chain 6
MLINVRVSELHSDSSNGLFLSFVVGIAFYSSVISILPAHQSLIIKLYRALDPFKYDQIEKPYHGNVSTGDKWDGNLSCATDISSIGNIIYTSHALWLMLVSLILLLAMVGAIVMTVNPVSPVKSVNFNKINNLFNSK